MNRPADPAHDTDVFIDLRRNRVADARARQVRDAAFETVSEGRRRGRRRRKPIWIDLRTFSLDGVYSFVMFLAMLFVQQAGSLSGVVMAGLPLLYMAIRRRQMGDVLATRWVLLLAPLFTILSVVWSEDPGVSGKYGVEMLLTAAAGIGLSAATRPTAVIKGACLAFALYVAVALGFGHSVGIGVGDGGEAFAGLSDGKNLLADIASTGALLSLTTLFIGVRQKRPFWGMFGLVAVAAEIYVIVLARSAGAVLGLTGAGVALLGLMLLSALPRAGRIGAITLLMVSAGVFAAMVRNLGSLLIGFGEQMFDKDPTLTGRTYLWYRAHDLIAEKPLFGRGFYAFWRQGNTDAEGLWQYAGIVGRSGFNFHNALVELMVQLGIIGAAVFCIVGLIGLLGLVRQMVERPSLPLCFWGAYMLYVLVRAPLEAVGYAPFYFSTCLLFAAAGYGLQRLPRRVSHKKGYSPQALRLHAYYAAQRSRAEAIAGAR
jgi:exopolysaccharide production protein ExoQ